MTGHIFNRSSVYQNKLQNPVDSLYGGATAGRLPFSAAPTSSSEDPFADVTPLPQPPCPTAVRRFASMTAHHIANDFACDSSNRCHNQNIIKRGRHETV